MEPVRRRAYGGFAKGMPKKLVKPPLVEPEKFFGLRDVYQYPLNGPQEIVTNRIVQFDRWSCKKSRASEEKRDQTQPDEYGVHVP